MTATTFDTIKVVHAEGLATRSDLLEAKAEIKQDVAGIKLEMADLRAEFKLMKGTLTLTLTGVVGILTLLLKLMFR